MKKFKFALFFLGMTCLISVNVFGEIIIDGASQVTKGRLGDFSQNIVKFYEERYVTFELNDIRDAKVEDGLAPEELKRQQAKGTVEAFSESYKDNPLNKLDKHFYDLKEDVAGLRLKYIREHPELFVSQ